MDQAAHKIGIVDNEPSIQPITEVVDDITLVSASCAGDEIAFELLFERHKRRVALIAGRFFKQREQIEEIVQESFTKAYFALKDFSNEKETSFASWIARIAFNTCYDELRRISRRSENTFSDISKDEVLHLSEKLQDIKSGSDVETKIVARDLANKFLSRLNAEDRLILVLLDAEELSVAEIADITKWSVSKVKVRAHRARTSLRRLLKKFL
jgi:RNA polymerase sigma-70 factor, ECF subfamily